MLDEMMEFFSVLKKEKPNAKFLFVTKDEHHRILACAGKHDVKDSIVLRPGAREEIPALASLADISIFFILPSYSKKASSPTKQGELMAMGIPVICNTGVGDTDKIVRLFNSGILVNEFSEAAYKNAIKQMHFSFSTEKIILGAKEYFSLENGVNAYELVYRSVS